MQVWEWRHGKKKNSEIDGGGSEAWHGVGTGELADLIRSASRLSNPHERHVQP